MPRSLGATGSKDFLAERKQHERLSLGRFAQNIGASRAHVSGWDMAVERMGGTAEEANSSLNSLSKALFDVHNMGKALSPNSTAFRAAWGRLRRRASTPNTALFPFMNDVAEQAQKLAAIDPQAAFRLLSEARASANSTANTMIKYGSGMGAYVASICRQASRPRKRPSKPLRIFKTQWARLQQTVES